MLTETWLNTNIPDESVRIPSFRVFRNDRADRVGGGVAFYVDESLVSRRVLHDFDAPIGVEHIWVELMIGKETILLGSVYRTSACALSSFIAFLDNFLSTVSPSYERKSV